MEQVLNLNLNFNFTTTAQDFPALLNQLLGHLAGAGLPQPQVTAGAAPAAAQPAPLNLERASFPDLDPNGGKTYLRAGQMNLRKLEAGEIEDAGWSKVTDLDGKLARLRKPYRAVLKRAVLNGGHISRDEVYREINRAPDKALKGFTRPVQALAKQLDAQGLLGANYEELLTPIYAGSGGFDKAEGFTVPLQVVVALLPRWRAN